MLRCVNGPCGALDKLLILPYLRSHSTYKAITDSFQLFSNKSRTATDEEILHHTVTSTNRYRIGHFPFTLSLVLFSYSSSDLSMLKLHHATLSELPAEKFSNPKWRFHTGNTFHQISTHFIPSTFKACLPAAAFSVYFCFVTYRHRS